MSFAQRDVSSLLLLHADWPTHLWSNNNNNNIYLKSNIQNSSIDYKYK